MTKITKLCVDENVLFGLLFTLTMYHENEFRLLNVDIVGYMKFTIFLHLLS